VTWTPEQQAMIESGTPYRSGDNDQPDLSVQGPWQYLNDEFVLMMRDRTGDVHPRGVMGVKEPAYLSPVLEIGRYYDVTTIDRDTGRQVQQPLVEAVLTRTALQAAMRQQVDDAAMNTLGVSLL